MHFPDMLPKIQTCQSGSLQNQNFTVLNCNVYLLALSVWVRIRSRSQLESLFNPGS